MEICLKFALLGLGAGGAYSLLALGIVLVYRGSGVVNFAHGAVGLLGAAFFFECRTPLGTPLAVVVGVLASALLGVVIQGAVMRQMRRSSSLMRVVATLGVVAVVQEGGVLKFGSNPIFISPWLPSRPVRFGTTVVVGEDRLITLGITVTLTALLWITYRRTRFGIATTAAAENPRVTESLGWSPNLLAVGNWAAGGALAGFAGILLAPITGISPSALTLAVVPALAAGLLGGFSSFPLTLVGGLAVGILESEATHYINTPGWSSATPFIAIMAVLLVRGKALPLRGYAADRLPRLGGGSGRPWPVVGIALAGVTLALFTPSWSAAVTTAAVYGFVALSLVVVLGYAGQLSLAQFGLAGVGALAATRLDAATHLPFAAAFVAGTLITVAVGALVALPAVRIRGVSLAVVTLGLAVVVNDVVLSNPNYTGGYLTGTVVSSPEIFGFSLDPTIHPARYATLGLVLFALAVVAVANIRRGRSGRRLIAVRENERAAASLGVSVAGAKLYAFSVSAGLAAVGGILLAFENKNVVYTGYGVLTSVNAILLAVIGGIGFLGGAVFAAGTAPSGPLQEIISHVLSTGNWYLLVAGLVTIVTLVLNPDGVLARIHQPLEVVLSKVRGADRTRPVWDLGVGPVDRVAQRTLAVRGLGVRFGAVAALHDVSLDVAPGEVLGLIGPNGAGKTTLIDAVTGFLGNYEGTVSIDGDTVDRLGAAQRARRGLTRSFQSLELFEDLTVADNLRAAADERDVIRYGLDLVRPGRQVLSPQAVLAVREFGLEPYLHRRPGELPYAQRRLVAIARAVAAGPSILLLDEPAAGLDEASTRELSRLIRRLADEWAMAVLLIEHDVQMVLDVCDRIVVLNFGEVLASGTPDRVRTDPQVITAYLGDVAETPPRHRLPVGSLPISEPSERT